MTLKTTLLAALGAFIIAAPATIAQPRDSDDGYYNHHRHYHRGCHIGKRGEYGVFGHYHKRLTVLC